MRRTGPAMLAACIAALAMAASASAQDAGGIGSGMSLSGGTTASFSLWEDRGSALVPAGIVASYASAIDAEVRAEAGDSSGSSSRCAFEGALSIDADSGLSSFDIRELWTEWRPASAFSLRAGRQRLGFGSGYSWNPSNDLEPRRDPSRPSAPRRGADALSLRIDAGDLGGFPLALSIEAIPPLFAKGVDLSAARLGAQLYAFFGGVELMATASASELGEDSAPWLLGGWATVPLGRLVLGIEGSARRRSDLYRPGADGSPEYDRGVHAAAAATATLRWGDFIAVGEAYCDQASYSREELAAILSSPARAAWGATVTSLASPGSVGPLHCLARLTWASGDFSASCGAIVDASTGAFVASGELSAAMGGRAAASLRFSVPAKASFLADDELGLSGAGLSAGASLSVYF